MRSLMFLMTTRKMAVACCRRMHQMLSTRSIVKQRCGMLEYCGLRCSRFLFNTYRGFASLFIAGADEVIYSKEGTTQADPLAMFL